MHLAQAIPSLPSVSASQPDNLERKSNLQGAAGVFSPASQEFFIGQHSLPHFQFHVGKEEKRFLPSWFCGSMDATELAFTTIGATHLLAILLAFFPAAICINELLAPQLVPPTFRIHLSANLLPLVRAAIGHKQTLRIASPSLAAG